MFELSPHLWAPHKPIRCRVRERGHNATMPYFHKYHIFWEKREGNHSCLGKDPQIPQIRDLKGSYKETLNFIWKSYKNSRIIVDQRARNIAPDLTILSFNCSRPKWWLQAPWWKVIWVSSSQNSSLYFGGEFLLERMCTFEAWEHRSNSWSITEFIFAHGRAKGKLGGLVDGR